MVAPECAPAAKAGGLGDVVSGLSRELELRGNAVEIILPRYASMRYSDIWGLQPSYHDLWVPWYGGAVRCTVWFGYANGRKCFFIEPHSAADFFGRDRLYGYWDDAERFAFFSKAALEFMLRADKRPDVIHCHDWQTGLVPVLLYEQYGEVMPDQRVCYTIHNFRHQGTSTEDVLWATQLGRREYFMDADRLGDDFRYRGLNPMKGGIVYSNFVTTVSPSHAGEALYGDASSGLGRTLKEYQDKFRGILNGVDYDAWNPEKDAILPANYSIDTIERKSENTQALRDRLWLRKTRRPVVAYVGGAAPAAGGAAGSRASLPRPFPRPFPSSAAACRVDPPYFLSAFPFPRAPGRWNYARPFHISTYSPVNYCDWQTKAVPRDSRFDQKENSQRNRPDGRYRLRRARATRAGLRAGLRGGDGPAGIPRAAGHGGDGDRGTGRPWWR